jgi:hypothetical protein
MLRTFLGWLRSATRDAILAGASDAAAQLAGDGGDTDAALAGLTVRLQLPAPEADEPRKTKRSG